MEQKRNVNLDIIRIFSAIMVLSVHVGNHSGINMSVGAKGVQLFFILSGFLGMKSCERVRTPIEYYKKRALRIMPAYYVALILLYLETIYLSFVENPNLIEVLKEHCNIRVLRYVFFLQTIIPSNDYWRWSNKGALWTMSSFFVFYLLAPFVYKIFNSFWESFLTLTVLLIVRKYIVSVVYSLVLSWGYEDCADIFAEQFPLSEIYCFMFGVVLYWAIIDKKEALYGMLLLALLIVSNLNCYKFEIGFTIMLMLAVCFEPIIKNERAVKIIQHISELSFTLYLIHPMVLYLEPHLLGQRTLGATYIYFNALYMYLLSFVATFIIYKLFIKPLEKLIAKWVEV